MSNPDTTRIFNYPEVTTPASDAKILLDSQTVGSKCIDANLFRCDLIDKTITQRGTFEASEDDADGFKKVVVDIPYTDVHVASGPIATFEGEDLPLKSLTVSIEPQQDLHGYDYPWSGGAGKNKYPLSQNINLGGANDRKLTQTFATPLGSGTYTVSWKSTGDATSFLQIEIDGTYSNKENGSSFSVTSSITTLYWYISEEDYNNNKTAHIYDIQLEIGNQQTTFEPYSNICPIIGWTEEVITRGGKNIFDYNNISNVKVGSVYRNGVMYDKAGTYTVSAQNNGGFMYVRTFNADGTIKDTYNVISSSTITNATFTIGQGERFAVYDAVETTIETSKYWFGIWQVQVELGNQATTYEPYNGATTTIPFVDGQGQSVTVYGGEIDVINGVVTPCPYYASYNGEQLTGEWISDRDVYSPNTTPTIGAQVVNIGATGTPLSVQPTSIKSLDGENNVFASTGDVDVEYQTVWVRPTE